PLDPNLLGQLYTLRARNAQRSNQLAAALEWSERALHVLPAENLLARSQATLYMGNAFVFADRVVDAILAFAEAGQLAQQAGDIHTALHALCNQGIMQITHGQLHQGAATFATGLALAKEHQVEQITMVGAHEANLATILYEWDRLEEAEARFRAAIAKYDHSTDGATKVLLRGHLALLLNAHGDHPGARQLIARLLAQGRQQKLPEVRLLAGVAIQLRLWMRQGETTAVLSWLRSCGLQVDDELSVLNYYGYNSLARALLHVGRLEEAAHLCARLVAAAASGRQRAWIELRALQALTWQAQGKAEAARQLLADTLRQAEPAGYIRTFVDEGEAMRLLILECRFWLARQTPAAQQGRLLAYVDRLLAAFAPANQGEREGASLAHPPSQNLVDPLSERELEVLRLAYEGLSNPQIATQLNVVVGTVKRHINNIFSKLGVTSRTQALARGRELGLLP
ncbi:MAG TPA: LuxR C-terminal-related transcriptional regulator, partial [Caldilineaceae bacterium]|nr:LuxR C-terminal-related transcriptional regulator [Caldilineaceae bacterium]